MFKRNPRSYSRAFLEFFYPRGGWYRAGSYVVHRIRRLPDPPSRIARGIAAGVFVTFTPLFGLHIVTAGLIAFLIRGNMLAAVLATFVGNPITFPIIAELSMNLGAEILRLPMDMHLPQVIEAFGRATRDILHNLLSVVTPQEARWADLGLFWRRVFLPYLVGGIGPGLIAALIAFFVSRPVLIAYQKQRVRRLRKRYEKRLAEQAAKADARARNE